MTNEETRTVPMFTDPIQILTLAIASRRPELLEPFRKMTTEWLESGSLTADHVSAMCDALSALMAESASAVASIEAVAEVVDADSGHCHPNQRITLIEAICECWTDGQTHSAVSSDDVVEMAKNLYGME